MDSKLKLAYTKIEEAFLAYEKLNLSRRESYAQLISIE